MAKLNFRDSYRDFFGEEYVEEKYKFIPHNLKGRVCGKHYCVKCGLVALNNHFSRWSVDMGCNSEYHPQYKQISKTSKKS
jgi:hypothetical protein